MNCPICGKSIIESEAFDKVACSNSKCKFNDFVYGYDEAHDNDFSCEVKGYRDKEGIIYITEVNYGK